MSPGILINVFELLLTSRCSQPCQHRWIATFALGIPGRKALQGAFREHYSAIEAVSSCLSFSRSFSTQPIPSIKPHLVRLPADLSRCDALIIPGGESTTMAIVARSSGLLEPLRTFVRTKPVWGTCAGAILLAESIVGAKKGGQEILGGIAVTIGRNAFGSQVSLGCDNGMGR